MKNGITRAALLMVVAVFAFGQQEPQDDCARTSRMRVYSNATYVEEAGDVSGIELAIDPEPNDTVNVLLYDYEGVPTKTGVSLPGRISDNTLTVEGIWAQRLRNSSGREVVHTVPVELHGTLDEGKFAGSIRIDSASPQTIRLLRVDAIWLCSVESK